MAEPEWKPRGSRFQALSRALSFQQAGLGGGAAPVSSVPALSLFEHLLDSQLIPFICLFFPSPGRSGGPRCSPSCPGPRPPGEPHRPSTASTTRPEISISQSELSMRSRRSGRRARLMTNTWRRQGRWVPEGWVQREGRAHPLLDPSFVGGGNLPHQTPSCWVSLGAGTRALRPAWGARPLQRKVPPIMNPYWLLATVTLQSP